MGTIYNYFDSKQDILLDIFASEFEDRKRFYEELSSRDLPLVDQIVKILDRHFSQLSNHQELMEVIIQERFKPESKLGEKLNKRYEEVVTYLEELVPQALRNDQIRPCDSQIIASALFGTVESVIAYAMLKEDDTRKNLFEKALGELAEFYWEGLKQPESSSE